MIGAPVSRTSAPRTRPSVGCIEIARTMLSPRCWATSRVSVLVPSDRVTSTCSALKMLGHRVARELGVDDRADDPDDAADAGLGLGSSYSSHHSSLPAAASALAPPTISLISWVIAAWRAEFISRV